MVETSSIGHTDTPNRSVVTSLRNEGIRVVKATLTIQYGRPRHLRLTRKSRRRMREADLSQLEFIVFIRDVITARLRGTPARSCWLIRFYPETEKLSIAPFRSNVHPEEIYSRAAKHWIDRAMPSEKVDPDLPYQHDRSVTFHMALGIPDDKTTEDYDLTGK